MARKAGKISITKLAEEAGVSIATVSRVMNQRVGVSDMQRKHVGSILKKYQFKANYPSPRMPKLAIVTYSSNMLNDYICKIVNGIQTFTSKHKMELSLIVASNRDEETIKDKLRDQQCSGAIVLLSPERKDAYLNLSSSGFPVIFIDEQVNYNGIGFIDNDSYSGSREAANHLIELGHRNIGYLQYCNPKLSQIQRMRGYENALRNAGIENNQKYTITLKSSKEEASSPDKRGYDAMLRMLESFPEITAVMTADDSVAHGAICAIHEKGLRIPEDISIIGFDNYPRTEFYTPSLTTVNHPAEEQGRMAAKAIAGFIKSNGNTKLPQEILETKLVIRKSTGPVRKIKKKNN